MQHLFSRVLAVVFVLCAGAASGCGGEVGGADCPAGTSGCACLTGDLPCRGSLVCQAGACAAPACPSGAEGCACLPGDQCGASSTAGMALTCDAGRCTAQPCSEGALGCSCSPNGTCIAGICSAGACVDPTCTPGGENCPCGATGGCETGLVCQGGAVCVSNAGFLGGRCFADSTCRQGNLCSSGVCVPCDIGTRGCGCFSNQACLAGTACVGGTCVNEPSDVMTPPAAPVCYSPCQNDVTLAGGTLVRCSSEGLIPLCPDGATCDTGSCVPAGGTRPTCGSDIDCPDFQACIRGRCFSNCESNADCIAGLQCHRKVCRLPCTAASPNCAAGQHCTTLDGDRGYCEPQRAPGNEPQRESGGSFELSDGHLAFSNIKTKHTFRIINRSDAAADFIVRKTRHVERRATGPVYVENQPLHWVKMGPEGAAAQVQSFQVLVDGNGGEVTIEVSGVVNDTLSSWDGTLVVESATLGARTLSLSYVERPEGRWAGNLYYFTSFGERQLEEWLAGGRSDTTDQVGNAFIQRWSAFRHGRIRTLNEWLAVLTATRTGSWDFPSTRGVCPGSEAACYLHDNAQGYGVYTDNKALFPVPSGVVDFPFAVHLTTDAADPSGATLKGRINTAHSLQYPANPAVSLRFANNPTTCTHQREGACLVDLQELSATVVVGGRYLTTPSDTTCSRSTELALHRTPWLVPGFSRFTAVDDQSGLLYRYECRDTLVPFDAATPGFEALNLSFAQSNPVPDGRSRSRKLELVDGALINNDTLFIIFRERFQSFLSANPADDFMAYGYLVLTRSAADLDASAFVGSNQLDTRPPPAGGLGAVCSPEILAQVKDGTGTPITGVSVSNAEGVAGTMLDGVPTVPPDSDFIAGNAGVHYLCVTSVPTIDGSGVVTGSRTVGFFDNGPGGGEALQCPAGSTVRYFVMTGTQVDVAALPCQRTGTCHPVFEQWESNCVNAGQCIAGLRLDPLWRCADTNAVQCDSNRYDLRVEKRFFKVAPQVVPAFVPLRAEIDNAFRYRTRFQNRDGQGLGFAPDLCAAGSDALPYCYDPPAIQNAAARVDCLAYLFGNFHGSLSAGTASRVGAYLTLNFAWEQNALGAVVADGFERLNAELIIMQGDDAYTSAFASRFDLAGSAVYGFEGSLFEPDGINLSGGAGYEMFSLYQATQYYQLALDRFYALLPYIWQAINAEPARNFVSLGTVTAYFDRLIRASGQKSRAFSEIAKRYQNFNRPDLARLVVERAYTSAYMESVILSHLMLRMKGVVSTADQAQVSERIRLASLGYRSALLQMRKVYDDFTDDLNYFGFAPDYIPFPALEAADGNAFAKLFALARQKAAVAADKELQALANARAYDSDAVSFQNELTRIRNNYDNQLAEICGTFTGDDGRIYPAIPRYAHLSELTRLLGNPCGFVGNGAVFQAVSSAEILALDLRSVIQSGTDVQAEINIEVTRAAAQCGNALTLADFQYSQAGEMKSLENDVRRIRDELAAADRIVSKALDLAVVSRCIVIGGAAAGTDCPNALVSTLVVGAAHVAVEFAHNHNEQIIRRKEAEIADLQRDTTRYATGEHTCTVLQTDSTARINTLALRFHQIDLEALKAQYRITQGISEVQKLRNQAQRLISEQEETQQQTINLEAARNNPNIRIYKNDAILTADRTFEAAVREAYRATKVFEYYTSQSYAFRGDLFLVRMVAHGDISLEAYLDDLGSAFFDFEERFGSPDVRVAIVSLRDDVMQIPRIDAANTIITQAERVRLFRERLADPRLLDPRGYTTLPFNTSIDKLSPLTRNHKVHFVESEIIGSDVGDTLGRVYLRMRGTGVVRGVDDATSFYAFPERTAVLNPFFNGLRAYDTSVYRNNRLRDRPVVNTRWEMVLNQRDEHVNQDININSLSDIRLYVYYTDFTPF